MLKQVYEIDNEGFLKEIYVADINEDGNIVDEDKQGFITVDYPNDIVRPKWNGTEWVEGESEEEKADRDASDQLEAFLPSQKELDDAELELKIIALLTELEVFGYE